MVEITSFSPPDVGIEEHVIRRLGWAVVRQWANLPEDARERFREQAVFTEDKYTTIQLNEQIKVFIGKHSGVSDAQRF